MMFPCNVLVGNLVVCLMTFVIVLFPAPLTACVSGLISCATYLYSRLAFYSLMDEGKRKKRHRKMRKDRGLRVSWTQLTKTPLPTSNPELLSWSEMVEYLPMLCPILCPAIWLLALFLDNPVLLGRPLKKRTRPENTLYRLQKLFLSSQQQRRTCELGTTGVSLPTFSGAAPRESLLLSAHVTKEASSRVLNRSPLYYPCFMIHPDDALQTNPPDVFSSAQTDFRLTPFSSTSTPQADTVPTASTNPKVSKHDANQAATGARLTWIHPSQKHTTDATQSTVSTKFIAGEGINATPDGLSKFFEGLSSTLGPLHALKADPAELEATLKAATESVLFRVSAGCEFSGTETDPWAGLDEGHIVSAGSSEATLVPDSSDEGDGDSWDAKSKDVLLENWMRSDHCEIVVGAVALSVAEEIEYDALISIIGLYLEQPDSLEEVPCLTDDASSVCSEDEFSDCFTTGELVTPPVTSPFPDAAKFACEIGSKDEHRALAEALSSGEANEGALEEAAGMLSGFAEELSVPASSTYQDGSLYEDDIAYEEALKESMLDELYGHGDFNDYEPYEPSPPATPSSSSSEEETPAPTLSVINHDYDKSVIYEEELVREVACPSFTSRVHEKIESSKHRWHSTRSWWDGYAKEKRASMDNKLHAKNADHKLTTFEWEPEILAVFKKRDPPISDLAKSRLYSSSTPAKKVLKAPPRRKARDAIRNKLKDYYQIPYDKPTVPMVPEDDLMTMLWDYVREVYEIPLEHFLQIKSLHRDFDMAAFVAHCENEGFPLEKWPTIEELVAGPSQPAEEPPRPMRKRDAFVHRMYLRHKSRHPILASEV